MAPGFVVCGAPTVPVAPPPPRRCHCVRDCVGRHCGHQRVCVLSSLWGPARGGSGQRGVAHTGTPVRCAAPGIWGRKAATIHPLPPPLQTHTHSHPHTYTHHHPGHHFVCSPVPSPPPSFQVIFALAALRKESGSGLVRGQRPVFVAPTWACIRGVGV